MTKQESLIIKELKSLNWKLGFILVNQGWGEAEKNIYWLHSKGLSVNQIKELTGKNTNQIHKAISIWKKKERDNEI